MRNWALRRIDPHWATMPGLSHSVYNLLVWAARPLLRRKLARRALNEPGYAVAVPERFGQ